MDNQSNLPYHGFNLKKSLKLGIVGWGRAVGWLLIGIVDSLEYIPKDHSEYKKLINILEEIISSIKEYQKEDGAFAWQISAREGISDSSATSMIAYALKKAIFINVISNENSMILNKCIQFLSSNSEKGVVSQCSAECGGLGIYPQFYSNFPWSQGPTTSLISLYLLEEKNKI